MSKQKRNLLIVAHPDDETLFFAGPILKMRARPWEVVCATDGNADGQGTKRKNQFDKACRRLGVRHIHHLHLPDRFEKRLDTDKIQSFLQSQERPALVFTHGPIGEYGHPHHQDVSWAVHDFYIKQNVAVWAPAYNCLAKKIIRLSKQEFQLKTKILSEIYYSETKRLIHFLPATSVEHYTQFSRQEVNALYKYLCGHGRLQKQHLKEYSWHFKYLQNMKKATRPF